MASEKYEQVKGMTDEELKSELVETQVQYQRLKFDHAIKGLENPIALREVRRDIARLKTELRSRELSQATEEELSMRSKIRSRRRKK